MTAGITTERGTIYTNNWCVRSWNIPLQDQVSTSSWASRGTQESPQVDCETGRESSVSTAGQMTPEAQQATQHSSSAKKSNTVSKQYTISMPSIQYPRFLGDMSLWHLLTANVNYVNEPHEYYLLTIIKHEPQYVSTRSTTHVPPEVDGYYRSTQAHFFRPGLWS